jgi:hypothetical protein
MLTSKGRPAAGRLCPGPRLEAGVHTGPKGNLGRLRGGTPCVHTWAGPRNLDPGRVKFSSLRLMKLKIIERKLNFEDRARRPAGGQERD